MRPSVSSGVGVTSEAGSTPTLRVGVLLDGESLPAWAHRLLWQAVSGPVAELVLVIRRDPAAPPSRPSPPRLFRAYERLDRRLFGGLRDHSERVIGSPLLSNRTRLVVMPRAVENGESLDPDDVAAIRAAQLDVLLQLGFGSLQGEVLGAARHGVWTFAHDEAARRGVPPFSWELARADFATEPALLARDPDGTRVLYRSRSSTQNSLQRNRDAALWKASDFAQRALTDVAAGRRPQSEQDAATLPALPERAPGITDVLRLLGSTASRIARNRLQRRSDQGRWFVALRPRSDRSVLEDSFANFTPVVAPPDRFYADPMLFSDNGVDHLFFEDAAIASGIGSISWCAIGADGVPSPARVVLERPYHLSYPFVFRFRDRIYMIPETSENRTIELYRAAPFPLHWQLEKVLFHDVVAADSTLLEHGGRLWLFVAMSSGGGPVQDELFLFHADSPLGDWIPHPRNPIVSDVRRARPAGPLFREDGVLYRLGQDCDASYGSAFQVCRVDVLDETEYHETPVRRVDSSWYPGAHATHTLSRGGSFDAIDAHVWGRFPR